MQWAVRDRDVIVIRCCSSRRSPDGIVSRSYSCEEIDAFGAYCADVDRCYFLPLAQFAQHRSIQLRLGPSKNNQRRGINWAEAYEFGATLGTRGAIAQLGERLHGMLEVAGSSPAGST